MTRSVYTFFFSLSVLGPLVLGGCGKNVAVGPGTGYPIAPAPVGSPGYYTYPNGSGGYPGYGGYNGYPYPNTAGYPYGAYPGTGAYPGSYPGGTGSYPYGYYNGPVSSPYGYGFPQASSYPQYYYPQMPTGYPQEYYPFLPVDNYYRNNPAYGQAYWNGFWNGWLAASKNWGVSAYNFPVFWYSYCPRAWSAGTQYQIYIHLDKTFYSWSQPTTTWSSVQNPSQFWNLYIGIVY